MESNNVSKCREMGGLSFKKGLSSPFYFVVIYVKTASKLHIISAPRFNYLYNIQQSYILACQPESVRTTEIL